MGSMLEVWRMEGKLLRARGRGREMRGLWGGVEEGKGRIDGDVHVDVEVEVDGGVMLE